MELTYLGRSCIRLRGRDVQVVIDPETDAQLRGADIVVRTDRATDVVRLRPSDAGGPQLVSGPGEYEIRGVPVRGLSAGAGTLMRVAVDEVRVVALGCFAQQLSEEQIDALGHVDVLVVPVGGGDALNASAATKLVRALEPAIVVPVRYAAGVADGDYEPVDRFASEMGLPETWAAQPKLNLSGASAAGEETRVVILELRS
ncbi:MAG: MBL fold metallo-hydrolase [Candidatus Dormibacteria bacterium]